MQVILVVPSRPERQEGLAVAANRLGGLVGENHVVVMGPTPTDLAAEVETRGSRADFLVIAQPEAEDDKATRLAFRAALFRTERPVLMVPAGTASVPFGGVVAIAWRDDARTLKAVVPALRLLAHAKEVHVLAGVRAGSPAAVLPPVLLEHRVPAKLHVLAIGGGTFGELLLGRARELGADMLIMGAHAHTALRDMLLGGVTSYVVGHAEIAVLLRSESVCNASIESRCEAP